MVRIYEWTIQRNIWQLVEVIPDSQNKTKLGLIGPQELQVLRKRFFMFIFFPSRFQCLWFGKKRKTDRYVQNHWRSRFFFSIFFLLQNTSCKNIRNNYRSEEKTIFSLPEKTIRPRKSLPLLSGFPAHVLYNRHRTTSNNDIFACYLLAVSFTGKKKKREREKNP